jgi:hypothetical protein
VIYTGPQVLTRSSSGVSINTFVLVKQVNRAPEYRPHFVRERVRPRCQYLYFCTSKASKVRTCILSAARAGEIKASEFKFKERSAEPEHKSSRVKQSKAE